MSRIYRFLVIASLFLTVFSKQVFAESSYVLPYPGTMPGSKLYKLDLIKEKLSEYWYFGDFAQFDYNLQLADKYLVEAKTLFEYKQYLLGYNALEKSNSYFKNIPPTLVNAKRNGKDTSDKKAILDQAAKKHVEELIIMKKNVPQVFNWSPEKAAPTNLNLWKLIDDSIKARNSI
ncbi:MAG TPA: hypothetical protein VG917_04225 [Patescibacteria group bacterium]|nr:hypothetical protein [Patescibacteria group bacterium]